MKATVFAALLTLLAMITLVPSIFTSEQVSAQMMNPNMMKMMRNLTTSNDSWTPNMMKMMRNLTGNSAWTPNNMGSTMMNPNMMNLMGGMMNFGQNVTGSINLMDSMFNSVASQIKVNLTDAVDTAQKQLGEKSRVVAANLGIDNGFLTYTIRAIDPDMKMHTLIIDPANGKVLSAQNMQGFHMMGPNMMGSMMMNPNMMGGMMTPWMMSHMWR
jgi:hypothetical protein